MGTGNHKKFTPYTKDESSTGKKDSGVIITLKEHGSPELYHSYKAFREDHLQHKVPPRKENTDISKDKPAKTATKVKIKKND